MSTGTFGTNDGKLFINGVNIESFDKIEFNNLDSQKQMLEKEGGDGSTILIKDTSKYSYSAVITVKVAGNGYDIIEDLLRKQNSNQISVLPFSFIGNGVDFVCNDTLINNPDTRSYTAKGGENLGDVSYEVLCAQPIKAEFRQSRDFN